MKLDAGKTNVMANVKVFSVDVSHSGMENGVFGQDDCTAVVTEERGQLWEVNGGE